jgi:hypothetical protein
MALMARLQFGDNMTGLYAKEFLVMDCHLHFTRHHNHFKPDTDARCEKVEVVVVAPGREDLTLYEWYIEKGSQSGRLVFDLQSITGGDAEVKFLEFEDAYCYSISEEYQIDAHKRRCIKLSFIAENMLINETEFRNLYSDNR